MTALGIDRLPPAERIALALEIWASLGDDRPAALTDAQQAELERRADEDDDSPENVIPWEQVKAQTRARFTS